MVINLQGTWKSVVNNAAKLFTHQTAILMNATQLVNLLIAEEENAKQLVNCTIVIVIVSFI